MKTGTSSEMGPGAATSGAGEPRTHAGEPGGGLTQTEAKLRLATCGPNEPPRPRPRGPLRIGLETLREPMFLLLIGATGLYLVLGDLAEGAFLVVGALAAIGLVILQEARSERAMTALRELAQPYARLIRGGVEQRVPAREIVPGDLLLVGEGERLPADGLLIGGDMLSVDESALTGESAPVSKCLLKVDEAPDADLRPGAELGPWVYAGAVVVRGQGVVRVERTGTQTALGQIGVSLAAIHQEPTPLQKTAGRLVALLGVLALAYCAVVAVAFGVLRDDWVGGALAGVTAAIALIPEEFPMVLAVFLALGAWRLASRQVLVRRSAVIETLGAASVLCVDKTGTLTENRMQVSRLWTAEGEVAVEGELPKEDRARELLELAGLASAARPIDPMDRAIRALLKAPGASSAPDRAWPLRPELMAVVQVWADRQGRWRAAAKGAPEAIFMLCDLPSTETARTMEVVRSFGERGLRVLGVAGCEGVGDLPGSPQAAPFRFAGLIGFLDPLRPDVAVALKEARSAGLAVVMITGDHPTTALAIARAAGIETSAGVLLGSDVALMSPADLQERLRHVRVFARIQPEQKLRLVQALKADGQVVAMTGDGVNDAPALEAAHIGLAMGRRGTDVAREAADLVLLDDSFASIVGGVRLGRRIFANLRKALIYITAIHVPIAGLALAPILLGMPPLLFPMHVVLLELAVDPMCSLVFEGEASEAGAMSRPPRRPDEPLFGPRQLGAALIQGALVLAGVLGLYAWALEAYTEPEARGAAFLALVIGNLALALADTASRGVRVFASFRRLYWFIAGATVLVMALVLTAPALAALFRVAPPPGALLASACGVGLVSGGALGAALRLIYAGRDKENAPQTRLERPLAG